MCAIMVCILSSATALAGVSRTVVWDAGGRLVIDLVWSFQFAPSSCLIFEERLPPGWILEPPRYNGYELPWWQQGDNLHLTVGVAALKGESGTITYSLVPSPDVKTTTVGFAGTAVTMQGISQVKIAVGGDSVYELPDTEPLRIQALLTGMTLSAGGEDPLLNFNFTLTETYDDSIPTYLRSSMIAEPVLYVDYRATLEPQDAWQCIHTSAPSLRISDPDVVTLPDRSGPGYYRLRMETD